MLTDWLAGWFCLRCAHVRRACAVLKTTGSAFEGFVRDEYTTLAEVDDRILSTSVDLAYTFAPVAVRARQDEGRLVLEMEAGEGERGGTPWDGDAVAARARAATLEVFAVDESASVQVRRVRVSSGVVCVLMAGAIGDAVQDGRADRDGERAGGERDVHAAEQALCAGGHGLHWRGQPDSVRAFRVCCCWCVP